MASPSPLTLPEFLDAIGFVSLNQVLRAAAPHITFTYKVNSIQVIAFKGKTVVMITDESGESWVIRSEFLPRPTRRQIADKWELEWLTTIKEIHDPDPPQAA